jgi:hypothetical protein
VLSDVLVLLAALDDARAAGIKFVHVSRFE